MKMPKKAKNIDFSYGLWKSNTPLKNLMNKDVEIYYSISRGNSYRIVKENNDTCQGKAYPKLENNTLYIYCDEAICSINSQVIYLPTKVVCKPNKDGVVICISTSEKSGVSSEFKLIKVK